MKDLIKQYLDNGMSRRQLMAGLSGLGMSAVASKAVAQSLAPVGAGVRPRRCARCTAPAARCSWRSSRRRASSTSSSIRRPATIRSSMRWSTSPASTLIKGIHEGAVVAMADGYARASGKTGIVIVANVGLPNAMTQMVNSWKDQIPLLVAVASVEQDALGRDLPQEPEYSEAMTQPITKWYWTAKIDRRDPGDAAARHEVRLDAAVRAGVPLAAQQHAARGGEGAIWDQAKFDVPMRIRPDKDDIEKAARILIEAKNPLISVGDEITWCRGEKEAVELAELLGLPVASPARRARLLVEAVPDPASALRRRAAARHALSRQARRAAQSRQPIRRTRRARHDADLDPARSGRASPARRRSTSAWWPTSGSPPPT